MLRIKGELTLLEGRGDTSAVADIARRYGYEFEIIEAVLRVNDNIKQRMVVILRYVHDLSEGQIRVLTEAYKRRWSVEVPG